MQFERNPFVYTYPHVKHAAGIRQGMGVRLKVLARDWYLKSAETETKHKSLYWTAITIRSDIVHIPCQGAGESLILVLVHGSLFVIFMLWQITKNFHQPQPLQ